MLITTGRGKEVALRQVARALFCAVPSSKLEGRGKRSLSSLLSKAGKRHGGRLCAIYSGKEGAACEIAFLQSDAQAGFGWLSPRIVVKKILFAAPGKFPMSSCLRLSGAKARVLSALLPPQECEAEFESEIRAGATSLSISVHGKSVLRAGVSYAE